VTGRAGHKVKAQDAASAEQGESDVLRVSTVLSRGLVGIAGVCIVIMLVLVVCDVLSRAVFNVAVPGIDTIVASYLMVAAIFLPLAMLQILEENIAVDVFREMVPPVVQKLFDIVGHLLTLVFYGLLAWLYAKVALESYEIREFVTGTWDVPIWPARIIMPLGLGCGALAAATKCLVVFVDLFTGHDHSNHLPSGTI